MEKIRLELRKVRHKIARVLLGLSVADRRIKHHKHRAQRYRELGHPKKAKTAERYLRRWQKRQSWLHDKLVFLQIVRHRRLRKKRKWLKEHPVATMPSQGLVELDGHQVAAWIARILIRARESGNWAGYVISGWRSGPYSREICEDMCGAPSCPGRCAGEATNHTGIEYPEGATDVSDPAGLQAYCRAHDEPLRGNGEALPYDLPHFSNQGN